MRCLLSGSYVAKYLLLALLYLLEMQETPLFIPFSKKKQINIINTY